MATSRQKKRTTKVTYRGKVADSVAPSWCSVNAFDGTGRAKVYTCGCNQLVKYGRPFRVLSVFEELFYLVGGDAGCGELGKSVAREESNFGSFVAWLRFSADELADE